MRRSSGFTLIEMLVTMSLLSMVVLAGTSAFSLFAKRWDGQLGGFDRSMIAARDTVLVQEALDNLVPYMVYDSDEQPSVYFEGNRNGFVAVSGQSILAQEAMAVVRFSVRQNIDFSFQVLYEEWPMQNDVLRSVRQPIVFSEPILLFEAVKDPKFQYFGWKNSESQRGNGGELMPQPPQWFDDLNSVDSSVAPLKVRFQFEIGEGSNVILATMAHQSSKLITSYSGGRKKKSHETQGESEDGETSCFC